MIDVDVKPTILLLMAALLITTASSASGQTLERPNIVLIVADYMGYSDIGPYGATDIRTPSLDSLAEAGVKFSSYYSASPVCGPSREATREDYVSMVEAMDQGIGRVLGKLDALELSGNTLVIFSYGHGGEHLVRSSPVFHRFATLWEGGIRVPLIIRWPGQFGASRTVERPTIAMDVTATMLAAAERNVDALELDGSSLLPVLRDEGGVPERPLFWRIDAPMNTMRAVRRDNWKYVIDRGTQLLFDLDADIGERTNLFAARPDVVRELRVALAAWENSLRVRH